MEMADKPKFEIAPPFEGGGLERNMETQKISVLDHANGLPCTAEKSDNFVIDMENFSHGSNKDVNANSRITLQRSLSRKGPQRVIEKKMNPSTSSKDREAIVSNSSPRATLVGPSTLEKVAEVAVGTMDHTNTSQIHHQITITSSNMNARTEARCPSRRNSFKRPSSSWVFDPKRVLFFFATISSLGTMLLIYFTISVGKLAQGEDVHD
ncbi:hypothetical protein K2173_004446 [Erythroxylum novogranatense]|uniref:Uncharacterized protein n=1 Tax=Erythroxylum novogranatense TaxID=1862640 RepID=A0AAV8T614_9ROSI|nr:hypothetical protein K2173_004446 [Erythroxylum novogranatense]